ncbi:uncharacterized protein [Haliotis cracherodii]|uniref:uncharacterized protein n=1 Tax=Haliotis cracherodii TaxID=6455 RepID=UPI0039ED52CA
MPRLTQEQRHNAIGRLEAGQTQQTVATAMNVSRATINRLWMRYSTTRSVNDRPTAGRPRDTTPVQDRYIRLQHLRGRFRRTSQTVNSVPGLRRISDQTVRNRLIEAGIRARRPVRRNVLTPRHYAERLQWSNRHRVRPRAWWRTVLFSDESRFMLNRADGGARVYRRRNERYAAHCVQQADRFGDGSVMLWAGEFDNVFHFQEHSKNCSRSYTRNGRISHNAQCNISLLLWVGDVRQ